MKRPDKRGMTRLRSYKSSGVVWQDTVTKSFARKLVTLMSIKNRNRRQVALDMHMSINTVCRHALAMQRPTWEHMLNYSDYFEVSLDVLMNPAIEINVSFTGKNNDDAKHRLT